MLRFVLFFALAATAWSAAVIRGTIVENRSGKALSRTQVVLTPISGTPGGERSVRTNRLGGFEFSSLAPGAYLVKATRLGFLPMEYGQKQWNSAGQPIFLKEDEATFLSIRLMRYGSVNGTVVDENDVGIPGQEVVAYRNTRPPQPLTHSASDERGIYRIAGLEPGAYLVRTAGNTDEEMTYIPTFSQETQRVEDARFVTVLLDEDTARLDVRPATGKLLSISGVTVPEDVPSTVTLAGDMGRQTAQGPNFHFGSLPVGPYELYAETKPGDGPLMGAYSQISLARDEVRVNLTMQVVRETRFDITGMAPTGSGAPAMQLTIRRKDLAGVGQSIPLKLVNGRAMIAPGRWEVMLTPPAGYYVSDFFGPGFGRSRTRPDGWNEFTANASGSGSVRFTLSGGAASLHGTVKSFTEAAVGAPVYLEAYDPDTRKRLTELRMTRTDIRGSYRFDGLAPGTYRILATFEYVMPDSDAMDYASARSIRIEARNDQQTDLDLYGIR